MKIDSTTYTDISVFNTEEEFSIFHKLNFTRTLIGKDWLRHFFSEPHRDIKRIRGTQTILKKLTQHLDNWPTATNNGTMLVMEKFLDYPLDIPPQNPNVFSVASYRILHPEDSRLVKYSVPHFIDFYSSMQQLTELLGSLDLPEYFGIYVERAAQLLREPVLQALSRERSGATIPMSRMLYYAHFLKKKYRSGTQELIDIYGRLDAWYSMAKAVKLYNFVFPEFIDQEDPIIETSGLYHILLKQPKAYDISLNPEHNFVFLTGANMAGKSTLIKAVGAALFLAHLGMGVPATHMRLTLFDGLQTNINVADNIAKGESYFYNEVQRIKHTIERINNTGKWLVLIDELFKGTNVQDAMKCSLAVIKGLVKIKKSLFILSTHLYEIGDELKDYPNISFRYFETNVKDDQLDFSYQLKNGVSNDRIGYVILKREKVVEMLDKL